MGQKNSHETWTLKKVWFHATKHCMLVNIHLSSVCREWGAFMYPKSFFFTLSCVIYFSVHRFNEIRCLSGGPISLLMCSSVEIFMWTLLPSCPPSESEATCISLNRQLIATLTEVSSFCTSSVIAGIPLHWFPSSNPYSKSWEITVERLLSILW